MAECIECHKPVNRPGLCIECVSERLEQSRYNDGIDGIVPCLVCGKSLAGTHAVTRWWRSKGKVIEARIHETPCDKVASYKRTYSKVNPSRRTVNKTWDQRTSDNREEREHMRLQKQFENRTWFRFDKGARGSFMFGRLTKAYMQKPHAESGRDRDQLVLVVSTLLRNPTTGNAEPIILACTDFAVCREVEDHVTGPGSVVGKLVLAIVTGANDKGYNTVEVYVGSDASELMREAMDSDGVRAITVDYPGWAIVTETVMPGLAEKVFAKKTDDIPF